MGIRSAGYCSLEIDFVSEWGRYNARQKIPAMDSTKAYSHCWVLRDVRLMPRYHDKLSECRNGYTEISVGVFGVREWLPSLSSERGSRRAS